MSIAPIQWRDVVIKHYGSIDAFEDRYTVEATREQVAKNRADLKDFFDIEVAHPGALSQEDIADMKSKDAELQALDCELEQWLAKRDVLKNEPAPSSKSTSSSEA